VGWRDLFQLFEHLPPHELEIEINEIRDVLNDSNNLCNTIDANTNNRYNENTRPALY